MPVQTRQYQNLDIRTDQNRYALKLNTEDIRQDSKDDGDLGGSTEEYAQPSLKKNNSKKLNTQAKIFLRSPTKKSGIEKLLIQSEVSSEKSIKE